MKCFPAPPEIPISKSRKQRPALEAPHIWRTPKVGPRLPVRARHGPPRWKRTESQKDSPFTTMCQPVFHHAFVFRKPLLLTRVFSRRGLDMSVQIYSCCGKPDFSFSSRNQYFRHTCGICTCCKRRKCHNRFIKTFPPKPKAPKKVSTPAEVEDDEAKQ